MNTSQLRKLGVPDACVTSAIMGIQSAAKAGGFKGSAAKRLIRSILEAPEAHTADSHFGPFASVLIEERNFVPPASVNYRTWGTEIDDAAHAQMRQSCAVPVARKAALMPDAHVGYGLPIGGVLACEGAVIPYAVGVDIACRMKLSVLDLPTEALQSRFELFKDALEKGTRFGVGSVHERPQQHGVMDLDWNVTRITREHKDRAWKQLGTSGSGNHFVEFGVLTLAEAAPDLGLAAGEYVALLSHSGSRGAGSAVCSVYSTIAQSRLPKRYEELGRLAWLDLESEAGAEYWAAMNLMGEYAAANHEVIHRLVSKLLGAKIVAGVENHHNFAWKEVHDGRELIVHRKGATPAGAGVLGVIPGSMADPAFVVRGKGEPESLNSASHGAGRRMSRRQARDTYNWKSVKNDLARKGVTVLSAGADEVPYVYKRIEEVMSQQQDLVEIVARFDPKIVKMCDDGSAAED
ncbi:MAG TPA: RtcB family protein [Planctomycetaceae bacterium]|nr:RtcB family protein [Planctomycetaceae bacterium]